jgi:alkylated DNA repair dioxygenase AlkB
MFVLKDTVKQLPDASTKDLKHILSVVEKLLELRRLNDFLDYYPGIIDNALAEEVHKECVSLNLSDSKRKPDAQWLSKVDKPYIYKDSNPIHHAKDITQLPGICKVMEQFNEQFSCKLDSCLVLKYSSSSASTSLHADDEENLDASQPICNLSLGNTRKIEFMANSDGKLVREIPMKDKSLVLMKPGTQQVMKHKVRAEKTSLKTEGACLRYSLSFRALAKRPPALLEDGKTPTTCGSNSTLTNSPVQTPGSGSYTVPKHVCLIAGDSYAARLDPVKLGRRTVEVVSVARGGANVNHVMDQLKDYKSNNSSVVVDKICISVGTNDLRYLDSAHNFKFKFKSLCSLIKELYPLAKVYFQLLLPLPCRNRFDWKTNSNIMTLNRIIVNESIFRRFHVLDAFQPFCMRFRNPSLPDLRDNRLFNGKNIHPSETRGIGVLAKLYIRAIHSNFFDPFTLQ